MAAFEQHTPRRDGRMRLWVVVAIVLVLLIAAWGIFSRLHKRTALRKSGEEASTLSVSVKKIESAPSTEELTLPANVQALYEAPIYARTSGYLKSWLTDIGTKVKAGQLLAVVESPEVDQQINQAQADLMTAEANEALSKSTRDRWTGLLATDSVSKQETDEKVGDYRARQTSTAAARANLKRLQELQGFERITSPFDGTVTARNTDLGQLIGNSSTGAELFHVSDLSRLRVYVQVPQPYAPSMKIGTQADLRFSERVSKAYPATIVRTAQALDPAARTLLVQLEVDNANGELFPGSYAEVHFKLPVPDGALRIPANALIFRGAGLTVGTLDADNKVVMKPVTVGRDFGTTLEVTTGLGPGDSVIVSPPDSLQDGTQVRIAEEPQVSAGATRKPEGGDAKNGQKDAGKESPKGGQDGGKGKGGQGEKSSGDGGGGKQQDGRQGDDKDGGSGAKGLTEKGQNQGGDQGGTDAGRVPPEPKPAEKPAERPAGKSPEKSSRKQDQTPGEGGDKSGRPS